MKSIIKKGIGGWLMFFVITVFLTLIALIISGFLDISLLVSRLRYDNFEKIFELLIHIIYFGLFIYFVIYIIYSILNKKPNTISLVKMYLVFVGLNALFEPFYGRKPNAIFYSIVFLLYFTNSKRIDNTFPKNERIIKKIDKFLFITLIIIFLIFSYIDIHVNYYDFT